MKKLRKVYIGLLIGCIASVATSLFTTFFFQDLFNKFENFTYDMRYKWQYDPQVSRSDTLLNWQPNEDVVVCDIDERSMVKYGVYHKWPRSYHGDVARQLGPYSAVTGFDIIFGKADFGESGMTEIEKIMKSIGMATPPPVRESIRRQVDYDSMFCEGVRAAGNVIAATQMSDSIEYQFEADWREKSTEAWRLATSPHSGTRLPDSIGRMFLSEHPVAGGKTVLLEKDALDGIFPRLAQAAARIGFVNVVPDPDGVHRSVPLFNVFRGYTYPALSLQMAMYLVGTDISEIQITLGKDVNLGKPFKVWRDSTGALQTSFRSITGAMVEAIVESAPAIGRLEERRSLPVSSYLRLGKDQNGQVYGELASGTLPQEILQDLLGLSPKEFAELKAEEPAQIGRHTVIVRYADNTFDLRQMDDQDEEVDSWEGVNGSTLTLLHKAPLKRIKALKPGGSLLLATDLTISRQDGMLTSECPVLRRQALADLIALTPADLKDLKPMVKLGLGKDLRIPCDGNGHHIITFRGPARKAFRYISYYDIREPGRMAPQFFQHKSVIVGSSATALFDIVASPFAGRFPGVEIHATLLSDFLDGVFMRKLDPVRSWLILLGMGIIMGTLSYVMRPLWAGLTGLGLIIAHFLVSMTLFDGNVWIEIVRPILTLLLSYVAVVAYQYMTEEKDRKFLHETFKQYLSPALIDIMYESKKLPSLGGEEGIRSAFFTDIQGFSTFSEKLGSPTKLVELLNEYLTGMTDILVGEQGTLDKFEGDAIIAFFGAPYPQPDHAIRACAAGLKMQLKLAELRKKWQSEGDKWPKIVHEMRMRIGINSGQIVTGNMGCPMRMNYTMMGDAVNLAARLESGSKPYGCFVMISGETLGMTDGKFITRQLDVLRVVGKTEPVSVHEVIGFKDQMDEKINRLLDVFGRAYKAYLEQRWDDAVALFEEALTFEPNHGQSGVKTCPSIMMKERCIEYKKAPPVPVGQQWDGVYTAKSK